MNNTSHPFDGWLQFHSVGRFEGQQAAIDAALQRFSSAWSAPSLPWAEIDGERDRVLALYAKLINAPATSVFAAENVTSAFHSFITAMPRQRLAGKKVLIAEDCFPSLHFLLTGLATIFDFQLVTVPMRAGHHWVEDDDFVTHWTPDVAIAIVTWITSTASKRADMERLVSHGRKMGSVIAVDITQGAGLLPFDVQQPAVDFVASTSLKWICGVPGAGMAYVAPALMDSLAPTLRGWHSQPDPFSWALDKFTFAPDARRFFNGTPSQLPFIASAPGLEFILSQPPGSLRRHNLALCHQILDMVDRHGLELLCPRADAARGGTIVFRCPANWNSLEFCKMLARHGFHCDCRGEKIRWSPGLVTTSKAMEALDQLLSSSLAAVA